MWSHLRDRSFLEAGKSVASYSSCLVDISVLEAASFSWKKENVLRVLRNCLLH